MSLLAFISAVTPGAADRLLAEVADRLEAEGWPLAGVVQINSERAGSTRCDMDLRVLGQGGRHDGLVRISQQLGAGSQGCRLDPEGLQTAVGVVEAALAPARPALLILNKFGKAEIEGRGFRDVIGAALAEGVPVLLGLKPLNRPGFEAFAQGYATALPAELDAVLDWARRHRETLPISP